MTAAATTVPIDYYEKNFDAWRSERDKLHRLDGLISACKRNGDTRGVRRLELEWIDVWEARKVRQLAQINA